eukprot:2124343-Amphidinium_carterae.1
MEEADARSLALASHLSDAARANVELASEQWPASPFPVLLPAQTLRLRTVLPTKIVLNLCSVNITQSQHAHRLGWPSQRAALPFPHERGAPLHGLLWLSPASCCCKSSKAAKLKCA